RPCSRSARSQQAFGARQHLREPLVLRHGHAQRAGERLEDRLDVVMARASVQHFDVDVGARADGEALEEVVHELGLQIADHRHLHLKIDHGVRTPAEIDRGHAEGLVHRHEEVAGAVDALAVADRLRDGLAERDAEIFDCVMLIDVEIPGRRDLQIEAAVPGEELQHVIEKADPGPDVVSAGALELQRQRNLRLRRVPVDYRAAHTASSSTARPRLVCSTTPAPIRRAPSHPGSLDRLRRKIPRAFAASTTSATRSPMRISTKLASLFQYFSFNRSHVAYTSALESFTWRR